MPFRNSLVGNLNANMKHQQKKQVAKKKHSMLISALYSAVPSSLPPPASGSSSGGSAMAGIDSSLLGGSLSPSLWRWYRGQISFTLTLDCPRCLIRLSPHSSLTRGTIEPYFVCFLENRRMETKQKSEILRGCLEARWEKKMVFEGLEWGEGKMKLEVKSNNR